HFRQVGQLRRGTLERPPGDGDVAASVVDLDGLLALPQLPAASDAAITPDVQAGARRRHLDVGGRQSLHDLPRPWQQFAGHEGVVEVDAYELVFGGEDEA